MNFATTGRGVKILAASAAVVMAAGIGVAAASSSAKTPTNGTHKGKGINEFGMTASYYKGHKVEFTYSKGFYCDTSVKSHASTGCEAGKDQKNPPPGDIEPLFITVPLGNFASKLPPMSMQCPTTLVCVDHPGTIDLSRLEKTIHTLKPYSGLSNKKLKAALKNYAVPGHEHFINTKAGGKAIWWDVKVVAVPSMKAWKATNKHGSAAFLKKEEKKGKVVGPIPTNLDLYFAVKK